MSLRIEIDGVEIPYKKDTFQIKETNNAFGNSVKIAHNEFPFLIIKTPAVIEKLQLDRLQNVNAKSIVSCDVIQGRVYYKGKIVIGEIYANTIKADIIYESDLIDLFDKKIRDFMPVIDVNGNPDPEPYAETSETVVDDSGWEAFTALNNALFFPNREWCFPIYSYRDYYDSKAAFKIRNRVNDASETTPYHAILNTLYEADEYTVLPRNDNMLFPKVFLLTPIKRCLNSLGYSLTGDFIDSFSRRLFFFSDENQGVEIPNVFDTTVVDFTTITPELSNTGESYWHDYDYVIPAAGTYRIKGRMVIDPSITDISLFPYVSQSGAGIFEEDFPDTGGGVNYLLQVNDGYDELTNVMESYYEFEADESKVGQTLTFQLTTDVDYPFPESIEFSINYKKNNKPYYQFHPTFDTSRYVPDWTFAKLLNEISLLFNTDFRIDEIKKTLSIVRNQEALLNNVPIDLSSYNFKSEYYRKGGILGVVLKYANEEDESIRVVKEGVESGLEENYIQKFENAFKYLPVTTRISGYNEELKDKDGIGLAIFDLVDGKQLAIASYDGRSLSFTGENGINKNYWVNWNRFRLNASEAIFKGPVTDAVINDLKKNKSFYINNQTYVAKEYTVSEEGSVTTIEITAESLNF
ncbi:hypothetical protein [Leeuwenhoekiella sp. CH_XMU1409-2]|uniref:hypothetical protein n=1 Tax=Leeuwenhoekiella sp. CH_XMU1409-2 TaxID=3107768 RepID=UPI0030092CF4